MAGLKIYRHDRQPENIMPDKGVLNSSAARRLIGMKTAEFLMELLTNSLSNTLSEILTNDLPVILPELPANHPGEFSV